MKTISIIITMLTIPLSIIAQQKDFPKILNSKPDLETLISDLTTNSHMQQSVTDENNLTDSQKIWGLMQIWSTAKYNFVFFDQIPDFDWDAAVQSAIPKVLATSNTDDYYRVLRELAGPLDDAHTMVLPPGLFSGAYDNPPVEFEMIDGKVILVRMGDTEEIRAQNMYPGLELLEIDDIPVSDCLEQIRAYYYGGTRQWQEAFGMYFLLMGKPESEVKLKLRDTRDKISTVSLTRNAMKNSFQLRTYFMEPAVENRFIEDGIVYIKLNSFRPGNAADAFKAEFNKLNLDELKGMILDIRYNSGGSSDNSYDIISNLIDQPVEAARWKTRKYMPAYAAWGQPEEWHEGRMGTIEPSDGKHYTGPLVLLVGSLTASAAEDFVVPLDFSDRAMLIGSKTAGGTGNPMIINLPGGGIFMACSKKDYYPDGKEFVGYGIKPDISVQLTQKDILENRDPVLEKAVEVIKNWDQ